MTSSLSLELCTGLEGMAWGMDTDIEVKDIYLATCTWSLFLCGLIPTLSVFINIKLK